MRYYIWTFSAALIICAAAFSGCATETAVEEDAGQKRAADIETLNTIMKLEESLAAYAKTLPGVENAEVKVRANAAVAILVQKPDAAISTEDTEKLRGKIASETGIPPSEIKIIRKQK